MENKQLATWVHDLANIYLVLNFKSNMPENTRDNLKRIIEEMKEEAAKK